MTVWGVLEDLNVEVRIRPAAKVLLISGLFLILLFHFIELICGNFFASVANTLSRKIQIHFIRFQRFAALILIECLSTCNCNILEDCASYFALNFKKKHLSY